MHPDSAALLWDARSAATAISHFIAGVDRSDYLEDALRRRAVEREFEIAGEALGRLRHIDPSTAARVPRLAEAVGMRNILIHGYATVVDERVYDTAVSDIPDLIDALTLLLAEAGSATPPTS
ncbi:MULTISPECIES: HepT-like ribonuclease domain-containing protein [Actinomyces]|uniref:DUF86 domain-containing protein n=1 Tax=Actinomyces respiraculi TaxID=2744574 RepID=A0A7T0PW86_9ACTO|nr:MULTISPECIES: HepT-like ribonuclease domain-containing protein [Actinomyces]QPL05258.1 DUF86 domain-containing protein [Actinomyces respiraculi]